MIRPSHCLAGAVLLMNALTGVGLGLWLIEMRRAATPLDFPSATGLVACVWLGFCVVSILWWRAYRRIRRLVVFGDGQGFLIDAAAWPHAAADPSNCRQPVRACLVWPGIMLLRALTERPGSHGCWLRRFWQYGGPPVVVLRDSVAPEDFRSLAVWMLWLRRKGTTACPQRLAR